MKMTKAKRVWRGAIMDALKKKGFNKKGARKTAMATMKRSIDVSQAKTGYMTPWSKSLSAEMEKSARVRQSNAHLHSQAAINQPSTMAGKIVVVPPERGSNANQRT